MKILISSLEPSANLHLKELLKHMLEAKIYGIFDENLGDPLLKSSDFSVMGFIDAFKKISLAKKAIKELVKLSFTCDQVLLIDSPAFNLPLAKAIKKANPKIIISYYILPKVWAWRQNRAKKVELYCDNVLSIFPFEDRFYPKSTYVGNPLLDEISFFKSAPSQNNMVAFLPGSRKSEIKALMPIFRELLPHINKNALLVIPEHLKTKVHEIYGDVKNFELCFNTHEALNKSDFAFICSGTASLECAIIGTPFVLVYKAKKLDFMIAKCFVKLRHIGLANILFDFASMSPLHEEFLQEELNSQNLLKAYKNVDTLSFLEGSKMLRKLLISGSSQKVAQILKQTKG